MIKVRWTYPAWDDRKTIRNYIAQDNPDAALKLDERVSEKACQLGEYPESGKLGRVTGTREAVVHPHYLLIYEVAAEEVRILRLLHTSRSWP